MPVEAESGALIPEPSSGMRDHEWLRPVLIGAAIALISVLHYLVAEERLAWQNLLQHLYLVPVMYAALRFGWRGGLMATAAATASYLPLLLGARVVQPYPGCMVSRIAGMVEYFAAAAVVGVLAEKDRRPRLELERAGGELARVNYELQGSVERMKRSERLYAVGQLAAGLAHEIRNPIASIPGAAGILERHPDNAEKRRACVEIISKECGRLNRLLTQFLDFARPRPPSFNRTAVERLADSVIELAQHAAGRQSISFRRGFEPSLPEVECDGEQIKQVLLNLMINAIQASPEGGRDPCRGATRGRICARGDPGPRLRHEPCADGAALRSLLHYQGERDRTGAAGGTPDRAATWRQDLGRAESRRRHDVFV